MRRGGRVVAGAYARADRAIDRGQHHVFRILWFFLPDTSITKDARGQQIMASRFFSDAGSHAVTYGALIAVVRSHGSAIDAALVGVAARVPPTPCEIEVWATVKIAESQQSPVEMLRDALANERTIPGVRCAPRRG